MLALSKKTDYALLLLIALAKSEKKYVSLREISSARHLPYRFVAQIARDLAKEKILESREGVSGGYRLAKPANKISVKDIVYILEGGIALTECAEGKVCKQAGFCPAKRGVSEVQRLVLETLGSKNLADFLNHHAD